MPHGPSPLVAVVDDDVDVRVALTRLISSAGFATEAFASGTAFMHSMTDHVPECLVLDLHMPELSGFEVQRQLAELESHVPVVIITGRDTAESRNRAFDLGARAYLAKPVDGEALLHAIQGALCS